MHSLSNLCVWLVESACAYERQHGKFGRTSLVPVEVGMADCIFPVSAWSTLLLENIQVDFLL